MIIHAVSTMLIGSPAPANNQPIPCSDRAKTRSQRQRLYRGRLLSFHKCCIVRRSWRQRHTESQRLNVNGSKASLEEIWRTKEMDNHHEGLILLDGNLYGTSTVVDSKK